MSPARRRYLAWAALGAVGALGARGVRSAGADVRDARSADAAGSPRATRGNRAAPIAWRDVTLLDGSVLPATALRGAPVVVEFWASWCPFCARQNPHLQALWEGQRAHGLRVLTFSIDKQPDAARSYLRTHRYTFPAAMDGPLARAWFGARRGLPMLYVVDATGRIVVDEAGEMFPEDVAALARFAPDAAGAGKSPA